MKIEKIIFMIATIGLVTALIQAIFRKMFILNLWGYITNTLYISVILLFITPLAIYGLIKLVDNLEEQKNNKNSAEAQ